MNKRALLIWAIVWIILGILVALSTAKELMANPDASYIFAAGLTLYCFYNGIRGIKRFVIILHKPLRGANSQGFLCG